MTTWTLYYRFKGETAIKSQEFESKAEEFRLVARFAGFVLSKIEKEADWSAEIVGVMRKEGD